MPTLTPTDHTADTPIDTFISYSSADRPFTRDLRDWLEDIGYRTWFDRDQIHVGDYFGTEIVKGLRRAKSLILICTDTSLMSDNCHCEIATAWNVGIRHFFPIWINPPKGYPPRFELILSKFQYLETFGRSEEEWREQLRVAVLKQGIRPDSALPPKPTKAELSQAASSKDWLEFIRLCQLSLRHSDSPIMRKNLVTARRELEIEEDRFRDDLQRDPRNPELWRLYLQRYPNGSRSEYARFALSHHLPIPELRSYLTDCIRRGGVDNIDGDAWLIAAGIVHLRLRNFKAALDLFQQVIDRDPTNGAAVFHKVVAQIADWTLANLVLERVRRMESQLQTSLELNPDCGMPYLLAFWLVRNYYEPKKLKSPFGTGAQLWDQAKQCGSIMSDYENLSKILVSH
jgi:tetratricopeptide (TPR) repeat protein